MEKNVRRELDFWDTIKAHSTTYAVIWYNVNLKEHYYNDDGEGLYITAQICWEIFGKP